MENIASLADSPSFCKKVIPQSKEINVDTTRKL